jgi:hypothetical protein
MTLTPKPENIEKKIRAWSENFSGSNKVTELAKYLRIEYPSIEFEINRGGVTLGALIGTISIEMKTNADLYLLSELKRDIPSYLDVSSGVVVIVSNPKEGIVEDFRVYLHANGFSNNV